MFSDSQRPVTPNILKSSFKSYILLACQEAIVILGCPFCCILHSNKYPLSYKQSTSKYQTSLSL